MFVLAAALCGFAQDSNNEDEVVKIDFMNRNNAVEGEIIVKFADKSSFNLKYDRNDKLQSTGMSAVDKLFTKYNVESVRQLCPGDEKRHDFRTSKSYNGGDVVERDLSRLCLVKIGSDVSKTRELIDEFNGMDEVEFAEPNYITYALGIETQSHRDAETQSYEGDENRDPDYNYFAYKTYRKEPYYSQQWGISATNIDGLWQAYEDDFDDESNTERPVIAILDTGVDITHPDLAANIWTNPNEIANGSDDDGNGFKDDLHGWDFVNKTGDVRDYNSHGTHCAGIAAAVGTNGKGVVGANPNAYIMPVTVMQSNGTGAISTIIEGIGYAKNNGADIISMSIGTYAYSIALEQALAQAYQSSVLVAAAGNDGLNIDETALCADPFIPDMPCYPAAFTFVLGVEATMDGGYLASFSNYDCDGPSYSGFDEEQLYNYELRAPGVNIISTVPNGQYKYFNGTSMACPLVAGGVSALLVAKDYPSQEMLWGDLINTSTPGSHVDFLACYEAGPAPAQLQMVTYQITDEEGDGDGRPDAGETLYFYPTLRTTWGAAEDITYWLEFAEYEDDRTIEFIENDNIEFGHNLSAYAKSKAVNPVKMKISDDVVDGRYIKLVLKATCPNAEEVMEYPFTIQVENGVELKGLIDEDMTLSPNVHYIVTETLGVTEGTTLTILPGTVIKFKDGISLHNNGKIVAKGEPGNMITFTKTDLGIGYYNLNLRHNDTLSYCVIEYAKIYQKTYSNHYYCFEEGDEEHAYFAQILGDNVSDVDITYKKTCLIDNCVLRYNGAINSFNIINSNLVYNNTNSSPISLPVFDVGTSYYYHPSVICASNNIIENYYQSSSYSYYSNSNNLGHVLLGNVYSNYLTNYHGNMVSTYNIGTTGNQMIKLSAKGTYLGSSNDEVISSRIYDIDTPNSTSLNDIEASTAERRPAELAHGIVWKVLVNGKDAQDEFDELTPLGVGRHKFEVYFNRAMNTSVAPMVAMGVRPPYTQNAIATEGSWSADSTIYTVYLDLDASSVTDGLNRIYVANAMDNEFFEIPFENKRFNVQVAAAGSMSTGFEATPGIGKVDLVWENDSTYFNDHLGWNMYRYQINERGNNTDTLLVNNELITDTLFTDFDVVPGERYYYFYKTLRTNLTESEASRNVSTVPLTAQPGDANGSLNVDVADIVTVVSYITGGMPQPFVFGAADVNGDGEIDVMDIVRIISIITTGRSDADNTPRATAIYSIVDGILYVDTPVELAGVQVYFNCDDAEEIEVLSAMDKFEQVAQFVNDGRYMFMAYSMSGAKLGVGKHAILRIGDAEMDEMILSDTEGVNVIAVEDMMNVNTPTEVYALNKAYPNPFNGSLNIPYVVGAASAKVTLTISNMMGQEVANINLGTQSRGEYNYEWQPKTDMPAGIYIINMYVNGNMMQREKVVYMK